MLLGMSRWWVLGRVRVRQVRGRGGEGERDTVRGGR